MLGDKYTINDIQEALIPLDSWHPFPTRDERESWEAIPEKTRQALIAKGDEYLGFEWTVFRATQFMEMAKTGLRSLYGRYRQPHRNALAALVVAECVEGKGRYLNDIIDGIWALCEESWWGKPWHLERQEAGADLSNIDDPHIDLFVAETASLLSWTCYLLQPQIDAFSKLMLPRVDHEMQERMLTPLLERDDYHWMGFGAPGRGLDRVNNWNPWIISNWITTILLMERDPKRRAAGLHKTMRALDRFIDPYPKDGGCDEGPGYWGRAGASMFECLESYHEATAGKVNVYGEPLIQDIGKFITRVQIDDHWFVNFADAAALVTPSPFLVYRYGKRIGDADMMGMGAYFAAKREGKETRSDSIARLLPALFSDSEILEAASYQPLPLYAWLSEIEVMTARDRAGSSDGFYVAMKGGHNSESHNHNDVGHYIVYMDGEPVIVDAGVEAYTGKTFSAERYDIWTMQSAYHSLPTIDGLMQSPGREFAAKDASSTSDAEKASISLDIAEAYPPETNLQTWRRTLTLVRGQEIRVEDGYQLGSAAKQIQLSLLTPCIVDLSPGQIKLGKRALSDGRSAGAACIHFASEQMTVDIERIDLTDGKSKRYWGDHLKRIVFNLAAPGAQGEVALRITRSE
ncbi:MAG: hypothetical protein GKR89_13855 [Candidatus Latescibacteria bacterium]|nr:hypothetical protein [Candidatus Latescibacterota bacterium]